MDFDETRLWTETGVDGRDFIDNRLSTGADNQEFIGTDWADVVFYSGHGRRNCSTDRSYIVMGDDGEACEIDLTNDIRFANGGDNEDANFLMLDASNVLQECVFQGRGWWTMDASGSGTQFTLINGFHGSPWDESEDPEKIYDYVTGAELNGVGDDWVDQMTDLASGANADECGVSVTFADSETQHDNLVDWGGMRDWWNTGTHDEHWMRYMCNCDPPAGSTLTC